jgi:hypothetical protein
MVRRQLYLSQDLNVNLKGLAREMKTAESEILREALTQYLDRENRRMVPPEKNPVLKMKGIFSGDQSCFLAGEKHDEIIYDMGLDE